MDYQRLLKPALVCKGSVTELDPAWLVARGIKGLILDFDDTLLPVGAPELDPEIVQWVEQAKALFQVWIVSNNPNRKFLEQMGERLGLKAISGANKPSRRALRRVLSEMQLQPAEVAVIGDRILTDVLVGNRLAMLTVLVRPPGPSQVFWSRGILRNLERFLVRPESR